MDWRELHLTPRSRAFNFAHRWLKVLAILVGFPVTTICLMALVGRFTGSLNVRAAVALVLALGVPAIVARVFLPRHDPLVAIGMPSETYALILLGFAVLFVVALHGRAQPLLIREGDRDVCQGLDSVARAAWFLGGLKSSTATRSGAGPCGVPGVR
jgi:hypothetical protein